MLCGGFLTGDSVLVTGPPGAGKTILGLEFIYRGADLFDDPGLVISFEELPEKFYRNATAFGWDFKELERQGYLRMICTSPSVFLEQIKTPENLFDQMIEELGIQRIFIDGLRVLELEPANHTYLRKTEYCVLNHFTQAFNTTTLLSYEVPSLLGPPQIISHSGIDFLADCVLMLMYVTSDTELKKGITVLKMRGSAHDRSIKQFMIGRDGLEIQSKLESTEILLESLPSVHGAIN